MKKHELPTFESRAYTHVRHRRIIEFIRFPFDLEDKLFPASGYAHTRNRRTYIYIYMCTRGLARVKFAYYLNDPRLLNRARF